MHQAGVPFLAFQLVQRKANEGEILCGLPFDGVFFTGSHNRGRRIAKRVAPMMGRLVVELGGKDPIYVADDADIPNAAKSLAEGVFYNTGQSCCAVERLYVHRNIYGNFVSQIANAVRELHPVMDEPADPMNPSTFIGPVAREEQVDYLQHLVHHAQRRGARIALGGKKVERTKGFYFEPTILTNVNHSMEVMHLETFGPVIGIQQVDNDEDAVSLMNDTDYGLTAGVFSCNEQRATDILSQVNSGTAYWNACDRVSPYLPWTGRKNSGVGSTLGIEGIKSFLKVKSWHLRTPQ